MDPHHAKAEQTLILPAPPSCIVRSSISPSAVIVGTYSLDQAAQSESSVPASRSGSLYVLVRIQPSSWTYSLTRDYSTSSAVLDISLDRETHVLAVATSTGAIELWTEGDPPSDLDSGPILAHNRTLQLFSPELLVLSLHRHLSRTNLVAVSLSDGSLAVVDCTSSQILWQERAHELEAWMVKWLPTSFADIPSASPDDCALLSGGDDSVMRLTYPPTGLRADVHDGMGEKPLAVVDRKIHGAGVTEFLPLTIAADKGKAYSQFHGVLLTGSYDDRIRVLQFQGRRWKCLAEENLRGGVWRLETIRSVSIGPSSSVLEMRWHVLASCMYTGCRVLEIVKRGEEWRIEVLTKFTEHESMNYASTWIEDNELAKGDASGSQGVRIISTSFYDKRFCVWQASPETQ